MVECVKVLYASMAKLLSSLEPTLVLAKKPQWIWYNEVEITH